MNRVHGIRLDASKINKVKQKHFANINKAAKRQTCTRKWDTEWHRAEARSPGRTYAFTHSNEYIRKTLILSCARTHARVHPSKIQTKYKSIRTDNLMCRSAYSNILVTTFFHSLSLFVEVVDLIESILYNICNHFNCFHLIEIPEIRRIKVSISLLKQQIETC